MTSSRYFVARVAQAFGYVRRAQRMGDAASEMHLLREAEAQLLRLLAAIEPLTLVDGVDLAALYGHNLISAMIDARDPD